MERATVGDIDICYRSVGDGHPVLMIMGFTANMDWWPPPLVSALSRHYRLVMFDNRGAGRTPAGRKRFSIKQFADDAAGLMDGLGIERFHVIGTSMGGMIAQELVLGYPERVERLVLCCTSCGGIHGKKPGFPVLRKLAARGGTPEELARTSVEVLYPEQWLSDHPESADNMLEVISKAPITPANRRRQMSAIVRFSTYRRLPRIEKPTLVLCGTEDMLVPPANSRILAERIPGAMLKEFENGGHGFMGQFPEEVAETVRDFLSR